MADKNKWQKKLKPKVNTLKEQDKVLFSKEEFKEYKEDIKKEEGFIARLKDKIIRLKKIKKK